MSQEPRYYYVDAQNQATGPIPMEKLLALNVAGAVTDATLVVVEGGTEWVAYSSLKAAQPTVAPTATPPPAPASTSPVSSRSEGEEPFWASQLSQKIEKLNGTMEKLIVTLEKSRSPAMPVATPATAALHAEKINLNPVPKPGLASIGTSPTPGTVPRASSSTPLSPLAVPANAQKSALPLPALSKAPGPAPGATPLANVPPAKGNLFSKFLKK